MAKRILGYMHFKVCYTSDIDALSLLLKAVEGGFFRCVFVLRAFQRRPLRSPTIVGNPDVCTPH